MRSKPRVSSAMTRVNTSSRPVELFGLAAAATLCGQREAFHQRHDVDAAGFQHRAVAERDLVQLQFVDALGDRGARSGQKARAHAKGDLAEPQIEAGGLDLVGDEVIGRQNGADACRAPRSCDRAGCPSGRRQRRAARGPPCLRRRVVSAAATPAFPLRRNSARNPPRPRRSSGYARNGPRKKHVIAGAALARPTIAGTSVTRGPA